MWPLKYRRKEVRQNEAMQELIQGIPSMFPFEFQLLSEVVWLNDYDNIAKRK